MNLIRKEAEQKDSLEQERQKLLDLTRNVLREKFEGTSVTIFLVGSVVRPGQFREDSDIDIILKGFEGNMLGLARELQEILGREVEIYPYDGSGYQEGLIRNGLRVI